MAYFFLNLFISCWKTDSDINKEKVMSNDQKWEKQGQENMQSKIQNIHHKTAPIKKAQKFNFKKV